MGSKYVALLFLSINKSMKKNIFIILFFCSISFLGQIKGRVVNVKGVPLSFVSVFLENTVTGTTSNENGDYILQVKKVGVQTIVFQFLGYKTIKKQVNVLAFPFLLNVVLEEENVSLKGITISTKENPANKIIKNVIDNKETNTDKYANYTAKYYSRGLYKVKNAPKKILGRKLGDFGGGLDSTRSGIIYLSETVSEIKFRKNPKSFKETIVASKVSGKDNGISFNRAQDAKVDFYDNSVKFGGELISPIATNAFEYYKYNLVGTFYDKKGKLINKIKIIPKQQNARVFNGFLYVVEDDWALYGVEVSVTGAQVNIPLVDVLHLKQEFNYSELNDAWVLINQVIDFKVKAFGFKLNGRFSSSYSNYHFSPGFTKKTFTNEVLKFAKNATKKDTAYWAAYRPVPLTLEEIKDYKIKDSIKTFKRSKKYLDSIDKKQNEFSFLSPITGYRYRDSYEKWALNIDGLIKDFSFNTVQGFNTSVGFNFYKRQNNKGKWWRIGGKINYGFSEKKARPIVFFNKKWNRFSKPSLDISAGVATAQFNGRNPITRLDNLIRSFLRRENYLKIYEKEFVKIKYSEEIKNGVFFTSSLEYANRKPLFNTSNFSFARESKNPSYTSNNPIAPENFNDAVFNTHDVAVLNVGARFVFRQKYLSYPNSKVNIGNRKFPVLGINYRKIVGLSNSNFSSDLFLADLSQSLHVGNYGNFLYKIRGGAFLKKKDIPFMDNLQANGNQLFLVTGSKLNHFGLLPYYKFFTNDKYLEAHAEHNFKGAVLGKIPLLNKLNYHLVSGAKTLLMADKNPYSEYYLGLDNVGFGKWRFFRVDYVKSSYAGIKNDGFLIRLLF